MDCSPPGFSVCRILQARILEWITIPSSGGSSWPREWTWISCIAGRCFTIWATRADTVVVTEYLIGSVASSGLFHVDKLVHQPEPESSGGDRAVATERTMSHRLISNENQCKAGGVQHSLGSASLEILSIYKGKVENANRRAKQMRRAKTISTKGIYCHYFRVPLYRPLTCTAVGTCLLTHSLCICLYMQMHL